MRRGCAEAYALSVLGAMALILCAGCSTAPRYTRSAMPPSHTHEDAAPPASRSAGRLHGVASYYGPGFQGRITASGERFNMYALTAAHKSIPFGTRVKVTNLENGQSVVVRVNDRGPYKKGRIIDLSLGAARKIGLTSTGTARVELHIMR